MSLKMRYFVLKPRAKSKTDLYANASQSAMHAYADIIEEVNPKLATDLRKWASHETTKQHQQTGIHQCTAPPSDKNIPPRAG